MTSAFVHLKARDGTFDVRIQVFPAFLENESENAAVKSLNAVSLARLPLAPRISYSADARLLTRRARMALTRPNHSV